ncbi:glutamine amidotransferase [Moorena sp. SIO4G3]|uniref:glutamine amidotransferase-related protein n=1 Tax=Moorena sp. SIO4G3 TaxID=2607821 RepID=UPI00142BC8CD|nr:glutamine amidotransferase [Moorena sp. SIO4G3]NEO75541.1 glutamine amidotransferase [Moorena sp. SIO4G3]
MSKQVLVIVHAANTSTGKVGQALQRRGFMFDRRCPVEGDTLPTDMRGYAACIIFGGSQSANDDHNPGIHSELEWLERSVLPQQTPTLGICLGAQLLARVMGARVGPHPDGLVEIGYFQIHPSEYGQTFLEEPLWVYQWHAETFEIPCSAVHLASSERFPNQAFCFGNSIYGLQFHPEMTDTTITRWCRSTAGSRQLCQPGTQKLTEQLSGYRAHAPTSDRWLERFMNHFLNNSSNG